MKATATLQELERLKLFNEERKKQHLKKVRTVAEMYAVVMVEKAVNERKKMRQERRRKVAAQQPWLRHGVGRKVKKKVGKPAQARATAAEKKRRKENEEFRAMMDLKDRMYPSHFVRNS